MGFEHQEEAEQFLTELKDRFAQFGLELHPEKTRVLAFGRKPAWTWRTRGGPKPGTFDFLGFTHSCGKTRKGKFIVRRQTMRKRMQAKLREVKEELRRRMHHCVPEQGAYLRAVVGGYIRYHGVPLNARAISAFRLGVMRLWRAILRRRSQKHRLSRPRMVQLAERWLPPARICHPYPWVRCVV